MQLIQVDAFTSDAFSGNPAAVCRLDEPRPDEWMQAVAAEMNLSETAFWTPRPDGSFDLRWFTPSVEVDLCGHATLATAHVLFEDDVSDADVTFRTRSGALEASRVGDMIELDFPAWPVQACSPPDAVIDALDIDPVACGRGDIGFLFELADEEAVRAAAPDFAALKAIPDGWSLITALSDGGSDFVSRYFAPQAGIDEDPVTGSAHCSLGPYWAAKLGRDKLIGQQLSARGGTVHVRVAGNRVVLGGRAVTVFRGELVAS